MKEALLGFFTNPQLNGFFTILGGVSTLVVIGWGIVKFFNIKIWKKRFNWDASLQTARVLLEKIEKSNWQPHIVLGMGRSGGIWGGWLAGNLGSLPFYVVDNIYKKKGDEVDVDFPDFDDILTLIQKRYPDKKNLLIIEGATNTGLTTKKMKKLLENNKKGFDYKFATLYLNPACRVNVEYIGKSGPEKWPSRFAWHERSAYKTWLRDIFEN